jgi:hypothetical protein
MKPLKNDEKRDQHVLRLIKTKPIREIQKIYPELNGRQIGKIIGQAMLEYKMAKDEKRKESANTLQY